MDPPLSAWNRPLPQRMHSRIPPLLYVPGLHNPEHFAVDCPPSFPYVPAGHTLQSEKEVDPFFPLHHPAGQGSQESLPSAPSLNVPAGQKLQYWSTPNAAAVFTSSNLPAGHRRSRGNEASQSAGHADWFFASAWLAMATHSQAQMAKEERVPRSILFV